MTGGAGDGVGSGISRAVARDGWFLVIADLDANRGEALAAELTAAGAHAIFERIDVGDLESIFAVVERVQDRHGAIRGLVNSAGVGAIARVADVSEAEFEKIFNIDLRGAWRLVRAVVPGMIAAGGGSIVNIGSGHGAATHPGWGVYAAAKAGLEGLTRGVAADYGPQGIRCNIVHPGMVDSPQNRAAFARFGDPEEVMRNYLERKQMMPVAVQPGDVGSAVAFLLSGAARAITGTALAVDAGSLGMLFDRDPQILAMLDGGG